MIMQNAKYLKHTGLVSYIKYLAIKKEKKTREESNLGFKQNRNKVNFPCLSRWFLFSTTAAENSNLHSFSLFLLPP